MDNAIDLGKGAILNYFKTYSLESDIVFGETEIFDGVQENLVFEYTGLIGISGGYEGGMYITCRPALLDKMYKAMTHQNPERPLKPAFSDLVGELANTLAGYFQKSYGDQFMISVPYVIVGESEIHILKKRMEGASYLIPFYLHDVESNFVVSVSKSQ